MAAPQLIQDFMRVMLLLAPSAAVICLVLAGLSLRQGSIPDAFVGSNFSKWMFWAIVFVTLPQLISWFPPIFPDRDGQSGRDGPLLERDRRKWALAAGDGEARPAFEAMMTMEKIDIAAIEAARQG
jgi:hypothetical protein